MASPPPNETLRVPPDRRGLGHSGLLAQRLRERPAQLDDVGRARMERTLVQAWRTHAAARVVLPSSSPRPGNSRIARVRWAASLAASAFAGGFAAFYLLAGDHRASEQAGTGMARFELRIGDAAVQSGSVSEAQVLESGQHGHIEVELSSARLEMQRETRLRFDRLTDQELAISLLKGQIDVDFHPRYKGEQRMVVESSAARVRIVGTRFRVAVDRLGNTQVSVSEGVVEVVPRSGAPTRRVAAGEHTYIRVDDGDEYERAVREAIERHLRARPAVQARAGASGHAASAKPDMDFSVRGGSTENSVLLPSRALAQKLDAARVLLRDGRHLAARARLRGLTESSTPIRFRVEALTLIAESYTAQADIPHATQAYLRADEIAPTHPAGDNARFALARLIERYTHDARAAAAAYHRYLECAPQGALASQARQALCRLGENAACE